MKNTKQMILAAVFTAAVAVSVSAQKDGDKNPPPKEKPPVIVVNPDKKPPKEDRPKDGKKPFAMIYNEKYAAV